MPKGYDILAPPTSILGSPNPNTDQINSLYQIIGDLERSGRFYTAQYDEKLDEVTQSVNYPTFAAKDGPRVVLPVTDQNSMIILYLELEYKNGSANDSIYFGFKDSLEFPDGYEYYGLGGDPTFGLGTTTYTKVVSGGAELKAFPNGGFIVYYAGQKGIHEIELTYSQRYSGTGYARNRKLWAVAV